MDLTGVDYLQPEKRTKVVYWLHNPDNLERLRLFIYAERGEAIPSVTDFGKAQTGMNENFMIFSAVTLKAIPKSNGS